MITYNTDGVKMPSIKKRENTAWVKAVAASYGKRVGEIAYIFVDDEKILEVNRQYLGHDYYTDIITFDYCEGDATSSSVSTRCGPTPSRWGQPTKKNCTVSSYTVSCTFAASTTRGRANVKSWRRPKTRLWLCVPHWGNDRRTANVEDLVVRRSR